MLGPALARRATVVTAEAEEAYYSEVAPVGLAAALVVAWCPMRAHLTAVVGGLALLVAPLVVRRSCWQVGVAAPNAIVSSFFSYIAIIE